MKMLLDSHDVYLNTEVNLLNLLVFVVEWLCNALVGLNVLKDINSDSPALNYRLIHFIIYPAIAWIDSYVLVCLITGVLRRATAKTLNTVSAVLVHKRNTANGLRLTYIAFFFFYYR